jgi:fibronectin type 3 domain-containing protein
MKKKCISLLVCAALIFTMLFALPVTAQAADVTLEVNHTSAGDLSNEIVTAVTNSGHNPPDFTKIQINIGSVDLSGSSTSGDWKALFGLNSMITNLSSLELVYTSGSHTIPNFAFTTCPWLRALKLTTSGGQLTSIGAYAFSECPNLTALSLPGSGGLTNIIDSAFAYCPSLTGTLVIPATVQTISASAFSGCSGLSALSFAGATGLTEISYNAFCNCSGLSGTLAIPSSVQSIGDNAFRNCDSLDALSLSKTGSLLDTGSHTFDGCSGLKGTLTLPDSLKTIGDSAFFDCSGFYGTVTIPSSVTSIGSLAFGGCSGLTALIFKNITGTPAMSSAITDQEQIAAYYPTAIKSIYTAQSGLPSRRFTYDDDTALITSFHAGGVSGVIDQTAKIISLNMTDESGLSFLPVQMGFVGSSANPASGVSQDFSSRKRIYTITSVSGNSVAYTVYILCQPAVTGSNTLSGTVGNVGEQTVFAQISGSNTEIIMPKAYIGGNKDIGMRMGSGRVAFFFSDTVLNGLAVGSYPITVAMDATSWNKAIASTKIGMLTVKPLAPAMKTATPASGSVTVNWNAVAGANGYKVYSYNPTTKAYTEIAGTAGTSYTQTGRAANTTYAYAVRSYQTVGGTPIYSDYSSVVSAKTPLSFIGIPSGFKAVSASYNSIKLTWSAVSGATNYVVYRATAKGGPYTQLTSAATSSGYTNTGLKSGTTYYYKIKAYVKINGTTVYGKETAVVSARPIPSAPGAMKAVKASSTSIKLTWGAVSGATKYEVYRATASGGKYTLVNTTTGKSFTNKSLSKGKTYYYKVCATRMEGKTKVTGAYSVIVNIKL